MSLRVAARRTAPLRVASRRCLTFILIHCLSKYIAYFKALSLRTERLETSVPLVGGHLEFLNDGGHLGFLNF